MSSPSVGGTARAQSPWPALVVVSLGLFMTLLDLTIVNIAIPSMITNLHATFDQVLWVLNAYSLVYAVLLIVSGRLGDIVGPRNLLGLGVVVFTAGSLMSSLAGTPSMLIAGRGVQGLGAAILAPQSLPILLSMFQRAGRPASPAFAVIGMLSGVAVLLGPTVGGVIVTHLGWRWIFYLNLPIGVVVTILAFVLIPDLRPGRRHRLDILGVLLATAGLVAIVYGLIEGQRYNWGTISGIVSIPLVIGTGAVLLVLFLGWQTVRQGAEPLVRFTVFRDRNYTLMVIVLGVMGFCMVGVFLPMTIFYQSVLGLSAEAAGLVMGVQSLAMMLASPLAAMLAGKFGKWLLLAGLLGFAAGVGYMDLVAHVGIDRWAFLPGLIVGGVGVGFVWTPVYTLATRDLRPELAGVGSGILSTVQELGGVCASAGLGALLQNRLAVALSAHAATAATQLPPSARDSFIDAFASVARRGLDLGSGATGATVTLPPDVPPELARHIRALAHQVFTQSFVDAMHPTLLLPVVALVVGALITLAVRSRPRAAVADAELGEESPLSA